MDNKYQIYGSKSSIDCDVMIFVDKIEQENVKNKAKIDKWNEKLQKLTNKEVNCNLAILSNGIIVNCYKGTPDEVNNSMYLTYNNHLQKYPNQIIKLIDRDVNLKVYRAFRIILSFLSKTKYRTEIKSALKGDFTEKIEVLKHINLSKFTEKDVEKRSHSYSHYIKTVAFQLGQTIALLKNIELYSKEDIVNLFPELNNCIFRKEIKYSDLLYIEKLKNEMIELTQIKINNKEKFYDIEKDDKIKRVKTFDNEFNFLSNFYPSKIKYNNLLFDSVEHAYQAQKTNLLCEQLEFTKKISAGSAKYKGKEVTLRPDWEDVKLQIMTDLVSFKFKDERLFEMLSLLNEYELIEGNYWHDNYWGNCYCPKCKEIKGQNNLGKILMNIKTI